MFIKKIEQFLQNMNDMNININDAINNSVNLQINRNQVVSKQFEFTALVARLFTLVATCLSLTLISIAILIFGVTFSSYGTSLISILAASVDVMVNSICLVLHWTFANIWYKKLCMVCSCYTKSIRFFLKIFEIDTVAPDIPSMNISRLKTSSAPTIDETSTTIAVTAKKTTTPNDCV